MQTKQNQKPNFESTVSESGLIHLSVLFLFYNMKELFSFLSLKITLFILVLQLFPLSLSLG